MEGCEALTEKEKQTLRLLVAGHDAKSMARHLGLSVHTINERLRDSRRKLAVSSSREAARLLRESEAGRPQNLADTGMGAAALPSPCHPFEQPDRTPPARGRAAWAFGGTAMLAIFAAALALTTPAQSPPAATAPAAVETEVTKRARDWLSLVDAGNWDASWAGTARSFRTLNTVDAWRSASEKARVPLGRLLSRTLLDEQDVPAPPNGYRMVRFRTDFANRRGVTETVSLDREGDGWKVVGVYIG